jgi:hypothetical protein
MATVVRPARGRLVYFFAAALLLAAQRAFINCESLFRPAAVIPPFFLGAVVFIPAFCLAQRAFAAAANLARVAADMRRRPPRVEGPGEEPPRIDERRFSKASICRRIEMASCKALVDVSMYRHIAGVSLDGKHLLYKFRL